jgi:isoleucyl-tRNA synthetase
MVLAPFIPYLAEEIYQNLTDEESVHLSDWPEVKTREVLDQKLLGQMELVRQICELGHAERKKARIKVRQPLASIRCQVADVRLDGELIQLIKEELNVKKIELVAGKELKVKLDAKITPGLKAEGEARDLVRQIQALRKEAGCRLDQKITVYSPSLPAKEELKSYIKKKTLAKRLLSGKKLRVV